MDYSQLLNKIIANANDQIDQLTDHEVAFKPTPEQWSKKELVGHLIDSAYNNHQRFLRASTQDDLIFQGYDQNNWVVMNNYQKRDWEALVATWVTANAHLGQLIDGLPSALLNRPTPKHNFHHICMNRIHEKETTTLAYLIWDYLFHLEHHLIQLLPKYTKITPDFNKG